MNNLKNTQKKFLSQEITNVVMEYMIGLNDQHRTNAHKAIKKSAKKIVRLYYASIKLQLNEMKKEQEKKTNKKQAATTVIQANIAGNALPNNKKAIIL